MARQRQRIQCQRTVGTEPDRAAAGGGRTKRPTGHRRTSAVHRQRRQHPYRHAKFADALGLSRVDGTQSRRMRRPAQ